MKKAVEPIPQALARNGVITAFDGDTHLDLKDNRIAQDKLGLSRNHFSIAGCCFGL